MVSVQRVPMAAIRKIAHKVVSTGQLYYGTPVMKLTAAKVAKIQKNRVFGDRMDLVRLLYMQPSIWGEKAKKLNPFSWKGLFTKKGNLVATAKKSMEQTLKNLGLGKLKETITCGQLRDAVKNHKYLNELKKSVAK